MDPPATEQSPSSSGEARPRRARRPAPVVSHNLQGQRLGRKGRDTRERIIAAAQELLAEPRGPGAALTVSEVARRAKLRVGSLYLYFSDLTELLLALLEPVMASAEDEFVRLLRPRWDDDQLGERSQQLVESYFRFWMKHSRILHLRNSMADSFDERMMRHRMRAVRPLMRLLIEQMDDDPLRPEAQVAGMAAALMTALDRVVTVTTDPNMPALLRSPHNAGHGYLLQAQARLIELAIRDYRLLARSKRTEVSPSCRRSL